MFLEIGGSEGISITKRIRNTYFGSFGIQSLIDAHNAEVGRFDSTVRALTTCRVPVRIHLSLFQKQLPEDVVANLARDILKVWRHGGH